VIVIIGENRTFDHVFATYQPVGGGSVNNLLSKGIIKTDGSPGPNYPAAHQNSACDTGVGAVCPNTGVTDTIGEKHQVSPDDKLLYPVLPAPLVGGPENVCTNNGNCINTKHCMCSLGDARLSENGLSPAYYSYLLTGGTNQTSKTPDTRIPNVNNLPPGPFQLTSATLQYYAYAASPVHRFYQMWQQIDCNISYATASNPGGCIGDLFPWGGSHGWCWCER
jgi:phospholipase C